MGMFDIIVVKDILPWTEEMKAEGLPDIITDFQTKDLLNCSALYKIENGRLLQQKFTEEVWVEPDPNNKDEFDFGHLDRKGEYWEGTEYHGKLQFYDYSSIDKPGNDCWVEFTATFTKGQLDGVEVTKFEKTDNTERLKSWKKMKEDIAREHKRWINKYFNHTKPVRWLRRQVWGKFWYSASQFCDKMRFL